MGGLFMTTMLATVQEVQDTYLLVFDQCTKQEVIVHTPCACRFSPCERVCIVYSGAMTRSIPPQITAIRITPAPCGRRGNCR